MSSTTGAIRLRVGVICQGPTIETWQAHCLEALAVVAGVDPVAVIVDTRERRSRPGRDRATTLWRAFRAGYVARRSRALRSVDTAGVLAGIPHVSLDRALQQTRSGDDDDDAGLGALGQLGLDVVMQLSPATVPPAILRLARRGVWRLHTAVAPGFWEILNGVAVTAAELHCRTEPDEATALLGRAFFRTRPHSYVHTLDDALFGAAALPARACRAILAGAASSRIDDLASNLGPADAIPTNADMFAFAARLGTNFVRSQLLAVAGSPQWNVGVVDAPIHRFLDASFEPRVRWRPKNPRGRFVADPFGLPDGPGQAWLVEAYDYATNRGVIAAVDPCVPRTSQESVLPVETHASYPFLLRHRGEIYCVPQLEDAHGIRIFRALEYPTDWEDAGVLISDVAARDATPFEHDGRWWLTYSDAAAPLTDLHVWWADDLLGEWHPHAANPVKIDPRSARPAGTPFVHAGSLYRPAQDCSRSYGGGVAICRVDVLTPTDFREEVVREIRSLPTSYRRGTHTLASVGEATLVDGKRLVFTLAGTRRALRSRLSFGRWDRPDAASLPES